jgi:YbbR domain-containing protein
VETTGKVPNGFVPVIDKMFLSHTSIPVAGPASLIKEIKEAVITIDLEGRKEHIDQNFRYTIYDKNGNPIADTSLKTNVPEVKVSLLIQKYKDIPVVLGTIIPGGGATEENTKITWDVQTVRVAGSEQLLNSLEQLDLGEVDLGSITKDGVQVIQLADCLPDGATIMSATKEARITIDLDNSLRTKTLTITQFVARNLPEEMMVEFLTTSLTVEFRGKSTEISKLTEAKVVAWVDFANAEPGTDTYTVKFEISGLDTIGAMSGTYTVSAVLTATPTA